MLVRYVLLKQFTIERVQRGVPSLAPQMTASTVHRFKALSSLLTLAQGLLQRFELAGHQPWDAALWMSDVDHRCR